MQPDEIAGVEYDGLYVDGTDPFWSSLTVSEDDCEHESMDDEAPDM